MSDVFRTMILDAADAPLVRAIADMFAGSPQNMWIVGLSADGKVPATHYISTGGVPAGYQVMAPWQVWEQDEGAWKMTDSYPGRPNMVLGACQQAQMPCTLEDIEVAFGRSDMTAQDPFVAMQRLGLQMVQPEPEVDVPLELAQEST